MSRVAAGAVVLTLCVLPAGGCDHPVQPVPRATSRIGALARLADEQTAGLVSLPWQSTSSAPADAQVLISVPAVQCYDVLGSQVRSATTAVTITVWGRRVPCKTAFAVDLTAVVQLPEPLGARRLAHAPTTGVSVASPQDPGSKSAYPPAAAARVFPSNINKQHRQAPEKKTH